jgi:hypothetical protein
MTRPTTYMQIFAPIRVAIAASVALAASLPAQSPQTNRPAQTQVSTLPATQPTAQTAAATPTAPEYPLTPAQRPPQRAQVTYTNGTLSVSAENSSLNQILRQIATVTGMKVTGGVADERVFGQYGPDAPAEILSALLDGTSSNMVLVQRDDATLAELILTPRQGGPTPPNPNAHNFDDGAAQQEPRPAQIVQPETIAAPSAPLVTPNPAPAAGTTPTEGSQPDSPNGVKTPQQIYEQLQRMRQTQTQTPPPATQPQE